MPVAGLNVVKVGGSLAATESLRPWLEALDEAAGSGVVVVPGGGPFADTVRRVQARHRFTDAAAHRMALLAMEQYGLMLCDLARKLAPAETPEQIRKLSEAGLVPVWMPSRALAGRTDAPTGWEATSDTLAAWLAAELTAKSLTLVKAAPPPSAGGLDAAGLAAQGYVDAAFAAHVAGRPFAVRVCGPDDHAAFRQAVATGRLAGVAVGAA